jgi:hypothetical protein
MNMPFRRRKRSVDLLKKEGPEFDHWLRSNVTDKGYRDWYRAEKFARDKWLDQFESQLRAGKLNSH